MPVEVMARRGHDTLLLRPAEAPGPGRSPHRPRSPTPWCSCGGTTPTAPCTTWWASRPICGFPEQRRVFSMIPALHDAEFLRYGVMHRNTFLNSPRLLDRYYRLKKRAAHLLCRPDDRRGGLCGVRRQRISGGRGDRPAAAGQASGGLSPGDRHRRAGAVCVQRIRDGVPAHEYQLRHHAAPGPSGQGQAEQECRAVPAVAGYH